jgi:DNA-binding transcriptional LysR family regulator
MSKLPDFEGLAMFAKVAEERSYAGAAQSMGVSVATVSSAVSRLEDRLGGRLFNRSSRQLALTDFGRGLADRAARIYN